MAAVLIINAEERIAELHAKLDAGALTTDEMSELIDLMSDCGMNLGPKRKRTIN